jgi:hypothetical protein
VNVNDIAPTTSPATSSGTDDHRFSTGLLRFRNAQGEHSRGRIGGRRTLRRHHVGHSFRRGGRRESSGQRLQVRGAVSRPLHLVPRAHLFGDVRAVRDDTRDSIPARTIGLDQRLINEIEEALLQRRAGRALQHDAHFPPDKLKKGGRVVARSRPPASRDWGPAAS